MKTTKSATSSPRTSTSQASRTASEAWDGGYVMGGIIGTGDAFIARDPNGIRPCFWYEDDEVVVAASERPVIQTAFNTTTARSKNWSPVKPCSLPKDGTTQLKQVRPAGANGHPAALSASTFSRGNDADIYQERMALGETLVPKCSRPLNTTLTHSCLASFPTPQKPRSTAW